MAFQDFTFQFGDTLTASAMSAVQSNFTAFALGETDSPGVAARATVMAHFDSTGSLYWSKGVSSVVKGSNGRYTVNYTNIELTDNINIMSSVYWVSSYTNTSGLT